MDIGKIDHWFILRIIQPFCRFTQRTIGFDCFDWAILPFVISIITGTIGLLALLSWQTDDYTYPIVHGCLIVGAILYLAALSKIKKQVYADLAKGLRNKRINAIRGSFLLVIQDTIVWYCIAFGNQPLRPLYIVTLPAFSFYIAECLLACTPYPPGYKKENKANLKLTPDPI